MSQPLIITGMHHSATSAVAELFRRAGVFMGERMLPPDSRKPRGYFEDQDFLTLQREMVAAAAPADAEGWPDWGWTVGGRLKEEIWVRYEGRARQLADARNASHPLWGWKDPRTTLLLDFWLRILPNARFILVCRDPWSVAASLRSLGVAAFDRDPANAVEAWSFYNRRLLAFHRAHPGRALILPVQQLNKAPHKILDRITSHFGFAFISHDRTTCSEVVRSWAPPASADRSAEKTFAAAYPDAYQLWRDLLAAADAQWNAPVAVAEAAPLPAAPPPPRISVIIPCFNDGAFLLEALASVDACPPGSRETVIVDDGSTDPATLDILAGCTARGYAVVRQENRGVAEALNAGIRASVGEYILPLSADNRIRPAYLARGIGILDAEPEVGVVYGDAEWFGARSGLRSARPFDFRTLHLGNYIDACAVFRRRVWEDAGGYDPFLRYGYEDWDLWLGAAEKGWKFRYVQEVLFDYRLRPDALSGKLSQPDIHREAVRHIVAKHPSYADCYADIIAEMSAMLIRPHMDAAEEDNIRELKDELEAARSEIAAARDQLQQVQATRSWKVTGPLRALHKIVQPKP